MTWLSVLFAILLNALASMMLKIASQKPFRLPSLEDPMAFLTNWPLFLGLFSYSTAFVLYAFAVSRLPLNVVYPVLTAGAIALVVIISFIWFKEPMRPLSILGICFVLTGVVLITRN
jgi:small multidrug resistance pump